MNNYNDRLYPEHIQPQTGFSPRLSTVLGALCDEGPPKSNSQMASAHPYEHECSPETTEPQTGSSPRLSAVLSALCDKVYQFIHNRRYEIVGELVRPPISTHLPLL